MNPLESSVALGLYACAEGTEAVAYAGTGATAEEVAVFNCGSAEAAEALVTSLETRNQTPHRAVFELQPHRGPEA